MPIVWVTGSFVQFFLAAASELMKSANSSSKNTQYCLLPGNSSLSDEWGSNLDVPTKNEVGVSSDDAKELWWFLCRGAQYRNREGIIQQLSFKRIKEGQNSGAFSELSTECQSIYCIICVGLIDRPQKWTQYSQADDELRHRVRVFVDLIEGWRDLGQNNIAEGPEQENQYLGRKYATAGNQLVLHAMVHDEIENDQIYCTGQLQRLEAHIYIAEISLRVYIGINENISLRAVRDRPHHR